MTLSSTYVKTALQKAGRLPKHGRAAATGAAASRGRAGRAGPPRRQPSSLARVGSRAVADLVIAVDDAIMRVLDAQLVEGGESLGAIMTALRVILEQHGVPGAIYTDRASWVVYTPTSGTAPDRAKVTR